MRRFRRKTSKLADYWSGFGEIFKFSRDTTDFIGSNLHLPAGCRVALPKYARITAVHVKPTTRSVIGICLLHHSVTWSHRRVIVAAALVARSSKCVYVCVCVLRVLEEGDVSQLIGSLSRLILRVVGSREAVRSIYKLQQWHVLPRIYTSYAYMETDVDWCDSLPVQSENIPHHWREKKNAPKHGMVGGHDVTTHYRTISPTSIIKLQTPAPTFSWNTPI